MLLVEFAQQKHLNLGTRLLLVAIEFGGEHARVVEDEHILVVEVVQDVLEHLVLNLARLAVQHHQARLVTVLHWLIHDQLLRHVGIKF